MRYLMQLLVERIATHISRKSWKWLVLVGLIVSFAVMVPLMMHAEIVRYSEFIPGFFILFGFGFILAAVIIPPGRITSKSTPIHEPIGTLRKYWTATDLEKRVVMTAILDNIIYIYRGSTDQIGSINVMLENGQLPNTLEGTVIKTTNIKSATYMTHVSGFIRIRLLNGTKYTLLFPDPAAGEVFIDYVNQRKGKTATREEHRLRGNAGCLIAAIIMLACGGACMAIYYASNLQKDAKEFFLPIGVILSLFAAIGVLLCFERMRISKTSSKVILVW